jgi:hypothetical protein
MSVGVMTVGVMSVGVMTVGVMRRPHHNNPSVYNLNYRCEVWGYHTAPDIEKINLYFLKRILKVRKSTVNTMVYCELHMFIKLTCW